VLAVPQSVTYFLFRASWTLPGTLVDSLPSSALPYCDRHDASLRGGRAEVSQKELTAAA
jgi:hypothetical protein